MGFTSVAASELKGFPEIGTVITPVSRVRKSRSREAKEVAQGPTVRKLKGRVCGQQHGCRTRRKLQLFFSEM